MTQRFILGSSSRFLTRSLKSNANPISPLSRNRVEFITSNDSYSRFISSTQCRLEQTLKTQSTSTTSPRAEAAFQKIIQLDMVEVHLLAELVNEKMGVVLSPEERAALGRGSTASKSANSAEEKAPEKEEKTAFDLKLNSFDPKAKIKIIKEIRSMTDLGLKEAKELVEGAPKLVKKDLKIEEAEELKKKLEAVGGTVEIL